MFLEEYFSIKPNEIQPFELFGRSHIIALLCVVGFICGFTFLATKNERFRHFYKWFLLIAISTQEIMLRLWKGVFYELRFEVLFNLQICAFSIVLIVIILIKYNQAIFELLYFWGIGGAAQALLTPNIRVYGFPHFRFFQIFISHGLIIAIIFYFLFAEGKRLRRGSLFRGIVFTNLYAAGAFVINKVFNTNFLYLNRELDTQSLLDFLGSGPGKFFWMEVVLIAVFSVLYIPVLIRRKNAFQRDPSS